MRAPRLGSLLLAFLVFASHSAVAHTGVCFRGRPLPRCKAFLVLEFSPTFRLNQSGGPDDGRLITSWSVGGLKNLSQRSALGAVVNLTANGDGHRYSAALRYRRWLSGLWSVDFSPGVVLGGSKRDVNLTGGRVPMWRAPSLTAELAVQNGDRIGLVLGIERLRSTGWPATWESRFGLRFGTWLAPLATVSLGLLAAASYH